MLFDGFCLRSDVIEIRVVVNQFGAACGEQLNEETLHAIERVR